MGITNCFGEIEKIPKEISKIIKNKDNQVQSNHQKNETNPLIKYKTNLSNNDYNTLVEKLNDLETDMDKNNKFTSFELNDQHIFLDSPKELLTEIIEKIDKYATIDVVKSYINGCYDLKDDLKRYASYYTCCNDLTNFSLTYAEQFSKSSIEKFKKRAADEIVKIPIEIKSISEDKLGEFVYNKIYSHPK